MTNPSALDEIADTTAEPEPGDQVQHLDECGSEAEEERQDQPPARSWRLPAIAAVVVAVAVFLRGRHAYVDRRPTDWAQYGPPTEYYPLLVLSALVAAGVGAALVALAVRLWGGAGGSRWLIAGCACAGILAAVVIGAVLPVLISFLFWL